MRECALEAEPTAVQQYVEVGDSAICLPHAIQILQGALEGDYLQGKDITTLEQFWQESLQVTFGNIGI